MKFLLDILIILFFTSCNDNISDLTYRNENFVFYKEKLKKGKWLKINPDLKIDLPKSHSTYFFNNGSRYAELEVIDSFANRINRFYDKNDNLKLTTVFKSDSVFDYFYVDGDYIEYHSNLGMLKSKGLIRNNLRQGKWEFYRENGITLKQIIEYIDDTPSGIREDYWGNGNLKNKSTYLNGQLYGEILHYYETGELKESGFYKDGKFEGTVKNYYKNGQVEYVRNFINGIILGTSKSFYENGQLKSLKSIELDSITGNTLGKEFRYSKNGTLLLETELKNNLPNGILIKYHDNGKTKSWQEVIDNKINGSFISYFENGKIKRRGFAKMNVLQGNIYYYNRNGTPLKTMMFVNGIIKDSIIH